MADEKKQATDQTIPGGVYVVGEPGNQRVVDANNQPLEGWTVDKDGNAVPPAGEPDAQKSDSEEAGASTAASEQTPPPPDTTKKGSKK